MLENSTYDSIIRRKGVNKIVEVLVKNGSDVLNINGKWGSGKTYVSNIVQKQLNKNSEVVALRFNISDYEYVNDPLVPFIITILDYVNSNDFNDEDKSKILSLVSNVLNIISISSLLIDQTGTLKMILSGVNNLIKKQEESKSISNDQITQNLASVKSYQKAITELGGVINEICSTAKKDKVVIFIDEFDRADPSFSFRVLNIIHQLKGITEFLQICTIMNRVQFERQLWHLYGQQDQDEHYLTKYIDLEYTVENPVLEFSAEFFKEFNIPDMFHNYMFLTEWISMLSIREIKIFIKIYNLKLERIISNSNVIHRDSKSDNFVYNEIFLLCIILTKFDLEFKSLNSGLFNLADCNKLVKKLKEFLQILNDKSVYENAYYNVSEDALLHITSRTFGFLFFKLKDQNFSDLFSNVKESLDLVYKEYFYI